jgi:translocation and assembly module TamB
MWVLLSGSPLTPEGKLHGDSIAKIMKQFLKITGIILLTIILILVGISIYLQTESGQVFLTKRVNNYLKSKIETTFSIKKIKYSIPDWIELNSVYFADKQGDTLITGQKIFVNMDMLGLLQNKLTINEVNLENVRLNIYRNLPDTLYNFVYIIKSFAKKAAKNTKIDTTKTVPLVFRVSKVAFKNVVLKYKDDIEGIEANIALNSLKTSFSAFEPAFSKFHFEKITIENSHLNLRMYPWLHKTRAQKLDTLDLAFTELAIKNTLWKYLDENSGILNQMKLGKLLAEGNHINLTGQNIHLKSLKVDNSDMDLTILKSQKKEKKAVAKTEKNTAIGWQVLTDKLVLEKSNVNFHDQNSPIKNAGIDFNNLILNKLNLISDNFFYSNNKIYGLINSANFKDKSGFEVEKLQTYFVYNEMETHFKKLFLQTPKTILKDEIILNYANTNELGQNLGNVAIKTKLQNSQIAFADVVIFFPEYKDSAPFRGNLDKVVKITGQISGKMNDLAFTKTTISGFDKGNMNFDGHISGLINGPKMGLNLSIKQLNISKTDLIKIIPRETVPNLLELPNRLNIVGKIAGNLDDLLIDANIKSDFGEANYKGKLVNFTSQNSQQYDGNITLASFEMGKFLKEPDIGKLTLNAKIKGTSFDTKTLKTQFDGKIQQAEYKGYNYQNSVLTGEIINQIFNIKGTINDPNLSLNIDTKLDISKDYPSILGNINIDKINLKDLGLYSQNIDIKGEIDLNILDSNPENPSGTITINNGTFTQNGKATKIENMVLTAKNNVNGKNITINAPFLKANLVGDFNYLQIPDIFIANINRYFKIPDLAAKPITEPYTLAMDVKLVFHPIIQSFFPLLTRLDTTRFTANFNSKIDKIFTANLLMPLLEYDTIKVSNVKVNLMADSKILSYKGDLDAISFKGFQVRKTNIFGEVVNNIASFNTTFKDADNKDRNKVNGLMQTVDNQYRIHLLSKGLTLNYIHWRVDSTGYFQYGKAGLLVHNFNIYQGQQTLNINSTTNLPDGPISIKTDSLEIGNFTTLFSTDSTLASGKIDGDILLANYMDKPNYKGDFTIKNLVVKQSPIGDLKANIFNETANKITVNATLINQNNDVVLSGNYLLNSKNNVDLNLIINKLSAATIAAFSFGELQKATGNIAGKLDIKGSFTKPQIDGNLAFEKVAFDVKSFGGRYQIDKQNLLFSDQKLLLNQFEITDTLNQKLVVKGTVLLNNLPDYNYDLKVDANNFLVLDSYRNANDIIYGKGIVDADLIIKGISKKAKIDGDIKIREKSAITIIFPSDENELGNNEGVVQFTNKKNPIESPKDTLNEKPFVNDFISEISLNIEVDEKSELTLVVDEINGDNLKVKGNGKLNAGINSLGKPYMLGSYDLSEGSYGITFEVLKKQFIIQKGSSIVWSGDPMNGDVDINAIYKVNTAPLDLMENEVTNNRDVYRQKMNFEVQLNMAGKLSHPNITFKIVPAETQRLVANEVITNVKSRLAALLPDEVNKQVFALLVLNRFFSEKSSDFFSTNNGSTNAAAFARQSVSKLLTDQLNQFTSGNIKGFGLDVNLSSSQDYFAGVSSTRTDLNLGLSKAFFNDKVEIKVGRNFELENTTNIARNTNEIFDNLQFNYKLSSDGKFLFKAFRKNQFQSVLEGFIVETGIGFSIAKDYGKLGDLFRRKEEIIKVKK